MNHYFYLPRPTRRQQGSVLPTCGRHPKFDPIQGLGQITCIRGQDAYCQEPTALPTIGVSIRDFDQIVGAPFERTLLLVMQHRDDLLAAIPDNENSDKT